MYFLMSFELKVSQEIDTYSSTTEVDQPTYEQHDELEFQSS